MIEVKTTAQVQNSDWVPLTDIDVLRPEVETHLWVGQGAVTQRPTGGRL